VNLNHENLPSILRITDFGTAKQFESFHSNASTVIGTIAWMAPEVFTGQYEAMPADSNHFNSLFLDRQYLVEIHFYGALMNLFAVWSFGIILYELLNLERPPKVAHAKPQLKSSVTLDPSYTALVSTYDICTNINPSQRYRYS
jgi:serine/threonine protein kinase